MTTYQGHLNDGSSVQKHSAGPLYPYIIYAKQCGDALRYGVMTPSGKEVPVGSYTQADALAAHMKAEYDQGLRH